METGNRKDPKTGQKVPIHYIRAMIFEVNGEFAAQANLGPGVSMNPLIGVHLTGAKSGDKVTVRWEDNTGEKGSAETVVK